MKNVFLIKTPLQLLNAIEAKYCFNLNADDCALIIMGDRKSQPQILALEKELNEWGNVIVLNRVNLFSGNPLENRTQIINQDLKSKLLNKSFFNVRRLNRIAHFLKKVDYVFIGDARYIYMKHFVNILKHNKVVLLDDGVATIKIAEYRSGGEFDNKNVKNTRKIKLYAKKIFQGVKDKEKESLGFFTMYDVTPGKYDYVVKNNFEHFKSTIDLLPVSDDVYFIGSPISETGILSQGDCMLHLKRVVEYFTNRKIIYIAHRRDSVDKLNLIKNELGLDVVLFDYPIEYQLALIGPRPQMLASFISSALDSCYLIFGSKLDIISFKLNLNDSPKREVVEQVYESYKAYRNESFRVVSDY